MRYLVTGAAGFIGYHVSRQLLANGAVVTGFDNFNDYYDPRLKERRIAELGKSDGFTLVRGDLADRAAVDGAFTGEYDAVIHLAAQAGVRYSLQRPDQYAQSNVVGFLNVLEACRNTRVPHLLYASSSSVYGLNTKAPFSTAQNVDHPTSLYAATKKANELMAHAYSHLFRLPTTGLRFFTVYGPWGRPDMAYFSFTRAILAGKPIQVFNRGQLWRDFTYIDDVAKAVVALIPVLPRPDPQWSAEAPDPASSSAPYRLYNLGNSQPVLLTEFIQLLERVIGRKAVLELAEMQPGDVVRTAADTTALRAAIGFAPQTPLESGLKSFFDWYSEYHR
jgi:UDP-glucuronate 4-epimerase